MNESDAGVPQEIHADYLRAGADIISTNTFRTHRRPPAPGRNADRAIDLTRSPVELARAAVAPAPPARISR